MLRDDTPLKSNTGQVAAQIIEGEAILINLGTGIYYSLDGVGAQIWALLERGASVDAVSGALANRHEIGREQARTDVLALAGELLDEGLIVADGDLAEPAAATIEAGTGPDAYEAPRLVRYDDMAELFALDPPLPELPALPVTDRS